MSPKCSIPKMRTTMRMTIIRTFRTQSLTVRTNKGTWYTTTSSTTIWSHEGTDTPLPNQVDPLNPHQEVISCQVPSKTRIDPQTQAFEATRDAQGRNQQGTLMRVENEKSQRKEPGKKDVKSVNANKNLMPPTLHGVWSMEGKEGSRSQGIGWCHKYIRGVKGFDRYILDITSKYSGVVITNLWEGRLRAGAFWNRLIINIMMKSMPAD